MMKRYPVLPFLFLLLGFALPKARADQQLIVAADAAREATLKLTVPGESQELHGFGAFISEDGLALVDLTCVAFPEKPQATTVDGTPLNFGRVLGLFPEQHLALIKFRYRPPTWLELADDEVEIGERLALVAVEPPFRLGEALDAVAGSVVARRSGLSLRLRDARFVRLLSFGASLSDSHVASPKSGWCAVDGEGRLAAFFYSARPRGQQLLIHLADVSGLAESIQRLAEADEGLAFPLDDASNPLDRAIYDPETRWVNGLPPGEGDTKDVLERLLERYPKSTYLRVVAAKRAETLDEVLALLPDPDPGLPAAERVEIYVDRAYVLSDHHGDPSAALVDLEAARALSPADYVEPRYQLVRLLRENRQLERAEVALREAYAAAPEIIEIRLALEELIERQEGEADEAARLAARTEELRQIYGLSAGTAREPQLTERVGELGDLEKIRFEGLETFTAEQIRRGLLLSNLYLFVSHPRAPLEEFEEELVHAMRRGYRDEGFPDVEVELVRHRDDGGLVVKVKEGPRFLKGALSIVGIDGELAGKVHNRLRGKVVPEPSSDRAYLNRIRKLMADATASLSPRDPGDAVVGGEEAEPVANDAGEDAEEEGGGWTFESMFEFTNQLHPLEEFGYPVELPGQHGTAISEPSLGGGEEFMPDSLPGYWQWSPGSPFSFSEGSDKPWLAAVRASLADLGYANAEFTVSFERDAAASTIEFEVDISALGRPTILGDIRVEGAAINTEAETRDYLGLQAGSPLKRTVIEAAELRLIESGRYLAHRFVLRPRSDMGGGDPAVDLLIQVTELPDAPRLSDPVTATERAMMNFARWLSLFPQGRDDLVIDWSPAGGDGDAEEDAAGEAIFGAVPIPSIGGRLILSPDNGLLVVTGAAEHGGNGESGPLMPDGDPLGSSGFAVEFSNRANALYLASNSGVRYWESPAYRGTIAFGLAALPDGTLQEDGRGSFRANLGAAFSSLRKGDGKTPLLINTFLAPVTILGKTDLETARVSEPQPGQLRIENGDGFLVVDVGSGRLVEAEIREDQWAARFVAEEAAFESCQNMIAQRVAGVRNEYDAEAPVRTFASLLSAPLLASESFREGYGDADPRFAEAMIQTLLEPELFDLVEKPLKGWLGGQPEGEDDFIVPMRMDTKHVANPLSGMLSVGMLAPAREAFPEGSWMRDLAIETIYALGGNREHIDAAVGDFTSGEKRFGPLALRLAAGLLDLIKSPAAYRVALAGYENLGDEDFRRDWQPLLVGDHPISVSMLRLLEVSAEVAEDDPRGSGDAAIDDVGQWVEELHELHLDGDFAGVEAKLEPLLNDHWNHSGSAAVAHDFEERLGLDDIDEQAVAVVVNGEPIRHLDVARTVVLGLVQAPVDVGREERERQVIEQLVDRKLCYLELLRSGGSVPDEVLRANFDKFVALAGGGDAERGRAALLEVGVSADDFAAIDREFVAEVHLRQMARLPDSQTLWTWYVEHPEEFVAKRAVELEMISLPANEGDRERIDDLRRQVLDGADFAELAKAHSKGIKASDGGNWGWVREGDLNETILQRAFDLEPGEVSEIFEDLGQYRLVRVGEQRGGGLQPFAEVREELAMRLAAEHGDRYSTQWMERLRRDAAVIPISASRPWTAWMSAPEINSLMRCRGQAFNEILVALEGRSAESGSEYRARFDPQSDPPVAVEAAWMVGLPEAARPEFLRVVESQGFIEVHHQEFIDEDGVRRHQSVIHKLP